MFFRWEYWNMLSSALPACLVLAAGCCEVTLSGLLAARGHLRQEEREVQGEGDAPEAAELRERRDPGKCLPPLRSVRSLGT